MDPKDKYYQKTFDKLTKGATVNEMYRKLYELEKQEKYDACACSFRNPKHQCIEEKLRDKWWAWKSSST